MAADIKGEASPGSALGRIASQFSLSRLYGWWVGPDEPTDVGKEGARVRSISLNDSLSIKLPTTPVLPGSQLSVCTPMMQLAWP